ncbi:MAG: hypothetical protein AAFQ35_11300, partial [Pseudomonadota bacterium]
MALCERRLGCAERVDATSIRAAAGAARRFFGAGLDAKDASDWVSDWVSDWASDWASASDGGCFCIGARG